MYFSIITCTYNSGKYLNECLYSLSLQNYPEFESVIIDGYSTDNTIKIVNRYKNKFPIRIFRQKPRGISAAMNYGIEKAHGEYLIHLHADDNLHDKSVLRDVNQFSERNSRPDWIYGKINVIEENGTSIGLFPTRKLFQLGWYHLLKYTNYIPHQAVFIRKEIFRKLGLFDESLSSAMDTDLWLRIGKKTRWCFYDRIISDYRIHPSAQSSRITNQSTNTKNHETVQRKYTNNIEFTVCRVINQIIWKVYKKQNLR